MRTNLSSQISLNRVSTRYYKPENTIERSVLTRFEKIPTNIYETVDEGVSCIADEIIRKVQERQRDGKFCTIAAGTGASLRPLFAELVRRHKEEGVSFRNVVVFNLYEYYPLTEPNNSSFNQLNELFLKQVDIDPQNVFTLNGTIPQEGVIDHCHLYEQRIKTYGGIDIAVMGIGREGNIGMNEPGSAATSQTRLILIDATSRSEAAHNLGVDNLPPCSITMGIGSFSGMYVWNRHLGNITDFFTGKTAPEAAGPPFGNHAITGYSSDFDGKLCIAEYEKGSDFASMPANMETLPMSLWNFAQEIHTGRIYTVLGKGTLVFIFFAGLGVLWSLITGYIIRRRKS